jgi:hypothetical protein
MSALLAFIGAVIPIWIILVLVEAWKNPNDYFGKGKRNV